MTDTYPLACKHGRMVATTTDKRARGLTQACPTECPPAEEGAVVLDPIQARLDELARSTRAKHMYAMHQALSAVLDYAEDEYANRFGIRRVIADAIGVPLDE